MKKYSRWQVAYRVMGQKEFRLIPNPSFAWVADPFLVEYQGTIYLFAELFLYRSERNGVIGYCKYENEKFGEWTVTMDKHWHLSYPNVFVYQGKLYMCPETNQREEIGIYMLNEFPDKWEKVCTWNENEECVDTTFLEYEDRQYMFTYKHGIKKGSGSLWIYQIDNGKLIEPAMISEDKSVARPGGNFIRENGKIIRVAQDCASSYGAGLVFCEVDSVWPEYKEHVVKRTYPQDIEILPESKNVHKKYIGTHTYNRLAGLEVIDLKYQSYSLAESLAQKRVRKVFLNKY